MYLKNLNFGSKRTTCETGPKAEGMVDEKICITKKIQIL